LLGLTNFDVYH